ncbi:MAG: hypothetical protein J6P82_02320 [Bacteroidales bacterium]|jgi:hypothetical protein|nr:hypothetical protein [Bacteroidales bacterium]MBP5213904.1 hypothetical protein [Bacteroidales bacterium]
MKAVFISFDQAHREAVIAALSSTMMRGFTMWEQTHGRGSENGEPHYGSHAWPGENSSILSVCDDNKVPLIMERLRKIDKDSPNLGLRAFVLPVEDAL